MKCYNCNHHTDIVDALCLTCHFPIEESQRLHKEFPMTFDQTIASTYIFKESFEMESHARGIERLFEQGISQIGISGKLAY